MFRSKGMRNGLPRLRSECKECEKIYRRSPDVKERARQHSRKREKDPKRIEYMKKYQEENREKYRPAWRKLFKTLYFKICQTCGSPFFAKQKLRETCYIEERHLGPRKKYQLMLSRMTEQEREEFKKERYRQQLKKSLEKNKERHAVKRRAMRQTNLDHRLKYRIGGRIRAELNGVKKYYKTTELIGCTIDELKAHLERQFKKGMSWGNYREWHIDHIIPVSYFDFTDPEQQKRCWHYTNLQPLWAEDNLKKGAKIIEQQLKLL